MLIEITKDILYVKGFLRTFPKYHVNGVFCCLWQVNTQLFSAREKQQLVELIDTMIGYNPTYHQERNFEGQYTYVLDP